MKGRKCAPKLAEKDSTALAVGIKPRDGPKAEATTRGGGLSQTGDVVVNGGEPADPKSQASSNANQTVSGAPQLDFRSPTIARWHSRTSESPDRISSVLTTAKNA